MNHQIGMFEPDAGKARRDAALDSFEVKAKGWLELARATAEDICREKGHVTSDDVKERIGEPPSYVHPNATGAMFNNKRFIRIGVVPSRRKHNNASIIGVWRLKE